MRTKHWSVALIHHSHDPAEAKSLNALGLVRGGVKQTKGTTFLMLFQFTSHIILRSRGNIHVNKWQWMQYTPITTNCEDALLVISSLELHAYLSPTRSEE